MQPSQSISRSISRHARTTTLATLVGAAMLFAAATADASAQDKKGAEPPVRVAPSRPATPPPPPAMKPAPAPAPRAPKAEPRAPKAAPAAMPRDVAPPPPSMKPTPAPPIRATPSRPSTQPPAKRVDPAPAPKRVDPVPPAKRVPPSRPTVLDDDARIPTPPPPARDGRGRVTPSIDDGAKTREFPKTNDLPKSRDLPKTEDSPRTKDLPKLVGGDEPRRGRPVGGDTIAPTPRADTTRIVDTIARKQDRFVSPTVGGVPISLADPLRAPSAASSGSASSRSEPAAAAYTAYVTGVAHANGWHPSSRWSSCGPAHVWQPYVCSRGLSISVGFGSGFSFGFFYGTSCAPLVSSWCNPWWDGYASYWTCAPRHCGWGDLWWRGWCRPSWSVSHSWNPCRPWWWST